MQFVVLAQHSSKSPLWRKKSKFYKINTVGLSSTLCKQMLNQLMNRPQTGWTGGHMTETQA